MIEEKTLAQHHFDYIITVNTISELMDHIKSHQPLSIQQGLQTPRQAMMQGKT